MFITGKHLDRRTVLKGLGVTLALPLLDAMVPAGAFARDAASCRQDAADCHGDGARRGRQHDFRLEEEHVVAG